MFIRISLKPKQLEKLRDRLHQAYAGSPLRLVKRIHNFAELPSAIRALMGRYCKTLPSSAAPNTLTCHPDFLARVYQIFIWIFALATLVDVVLFGYISVKTPLYRFSPDSMNYVDVARNIVAGRGIVQSAAGFNEPHFSPDVRIPMPLTSQPPGYPLLIALVGFLGVPLDSAALMVSAFGFGLVLLGSYLLSRQLYDEHVALVAMVGLEAFAPLYWVSGIAWSEAVGMGLVVLSLWLLVRARQTAGGPAWIPILAGLTSGLAFATRYAFLELFVIGPLILIDPKDRRCTVRNIGLYMASYALPAGLVLGRNLVMSDTLMGTARNPSTVGLAENIRAAYEVIFGNYFGHPLYWKMFGPFLGTQLDPAIQMNIAWLVLGGLLVALLIQRKLLAALAFGQRYLLPLWSILYLALLISQRTLNHFDPIDSRLVFPGGVTLILMVAGLIVTATHLKAKYLIYPALFFVCFVVKDTWTASVEIGNYQYDIRQVFYRQPLLEWIAQNTTNRDLIIGDYTMSIPFYLNRTSVVSFSPYPYSDKPEYEKISAFVHKHCGEYERTYLVLHDYGSDPQEWQNMFGPFIADIRANRLEAYPDIVSRLNIDGGFVYIMRCQ